MRLSRFHLHTTKETPADAELVSHKLMLRAGMIRKLASGLYTWSPLGLRVLRKVEGIVREEMNRAGAVELQLPTIQPRELWEETGRWEKFGGQLLKIKDRKEQEYCYSPTAEEAITDFARQELSSYKQLPVNFYQVQTKFRDEIRPRFGVMRAREFLMKDAYSFHLDDASLVAEYENMKAAYTRIFTRLGLEFRAVQADSGAIGGDASQEFHVIADSGEDALAFSTGSDYAANVEAAVAADPAPRAAATETLRKVETPTQKTCEDVAALLGIALARTVKSVAVMSADDAFVLALVRGDHEVNEIKLGKVAGLADHRMASEAEIAEYLGSEPGFLGPLDPRKAIRIVADREVAALADFVVGANETGFHIAGVNWGRDLAEPEVADIRNVVAGDRARDGGELKLARGIEVGHVFQLGRKYAEALKATVLDENGKATVMAMGCYGIGVSRIVAAAIEQNHDEAGIIWPVAMAPWQAVVCMINPKQDPAVTAAAEALLAELQAAGIDAALDDRGLRPGAMFADMELIGIPHRIVVSERGLAAGTYEYRARAASEAENLDKAGLLHRITG
ncbi:MAG: proline--tRNA ligase [Lysobacteraceae bacterium SCN 69-123]|uniref:proline--tRNA ligase n=1 Tax=Stenotrophomonas acidaminiphila TaxID=128780 RepID=UPI00086B78CB|nr:proline--tRNA ligase [Stenotrophomonas acidaminiphila]MBN8801983.1 proline--tRNA ligase [Stenotrophomonas acidaminiphila]MDF9442192.1 proline--tRNA ligase [Stenotrophomonas acidaminiphila]ODU44279.1 MAG: proline--tRNA ligase [Xanthomonadaceae bacterium SCN 69-123]OJY80591.1 MAG: proline--tRNA ligase [Stenotrophomonas sp. 69-14]